MRRRAGWSPCEPAMTELPRCTECREPIGAGEPLIAQRPDGDVVRSQVLVSGSGGDEPYGTLIFHRDCFPAPLPEP